MKHRVVLEGFPTLKIGDTIETPDVAELLRNPMFFSAEADYVYKHGGEINRRFLDLTPLTNTKKYVNVSVKLQYLTPQISPINNIEWHCDPGVIAPYKHDAITHLFITGSKDDRVSSLTEFLEEQVIFETNEPIEKMGHREFRGLLDSKAIDLNFIPKKMEQDKFLTFKAIHPHRAIYPTKHEFRLIWRVVESNNMPHKSNEQLKSSPAMIIDSDKSVREISNIEQHDNWIIIRDKINLY